MAAAIEFYFDFSSPYGYLAARRTDAVAEEYGRDIPLKGDYARRDLARSARRFDIPLVLPEAFPFMSVAACRATYWLGERGAADAKKLAAALFDAAFGAGQSISRPEEVAAIAAALGHDEDEVRAAVQDQRIKDLLRHEVDAAIAKGVFGSPYIIVDGEPFWGFDRLDEIALWLKTGGW